jgi:hypothetical protein
MDTDLADTETGRKVEARDDGAPRAATTINSEKMRKVGGYPRYERGGSPEMLR